MKKLMRLLTLPALLLALLLPLTASIASAHGRVDVGEYELVIGFINEPAYQGEPNGLDLRVRVKASQEPVMELADKLKAKIIYGSQERELTLRPRFGQDGAYTANVLPTQSGDYTFVITGEINGTPVDVKMTSSGETFNAVQTKADVSFPAAEKTPAELTMELESARGSAQTALYIGIAGLVVGVVGLALGLLGRRSRVAA